MSTVLLTGAPGVGKTTLIKKLTEELQKRAIKFIGFYTEEVRNEEHQRIGFDIKSFDGNHSILARNGSNLIPNAKTINRIGQYHVYINNFEEILKLFIKSDCQIVIIDEIGSMELLSKVFQNYMENVINNLNLKSIVLIATIPLNNRRSNSIIENLKNLDGAKLFTMTKTNRNEMYTKILDETVKII